MDGFSPNLNKVLHIGHFSNLIIAKAFVYMGVSGEILAIYGDTLDGLPKEVCYKELKKWEDLFGYYVDSRSEYYASEVEYRGNSLKPGRGKYEGTQVFDVNGNKIVGVKSDGSTSYFYQDASLAEEFNGKSILYLTGKEQAEHFANLKVLYPKTKHIGLGLVTLKGKKMSSRTGDVIYMHEIVSELQKEFHNIELVYNIIAGLILKSNPDADKKIDFDTLSNPKNSIGLYISYTMARLFSAGCESQKTLTIVNNQLEYSVHSIDLNYAYHKAKFNLKPNILLEAIESHCHKINKLYDTHMIKGNEENKKMFDLLLSDLTISAQKIGLFTIQKV